MAQTPLPPGARCAIHPDRAAERTCERCGNYLCDECGSGGPNELCAACTSRLGGQGAFPFTRDRYSLDGLLKLSYARWKDNWTQFLLLFGGLIVFVYAVSIGGELVLDWIADRQGESSPLQSQLHPIRIGYQIAMTLLQLVLQLLVLGVCLDVLHGRKSDLPAAVERLRQLPNALLQLLIVYAVLGLLFGLFALLFFGLGGFEAGWMPFAVTAGTAVVLVPVLAYVQLGVMFSLLVLLQQPEANAFSAIGRSWQIVAGHRFEVLGISLVAGLIAFAGVLACCVGIFVSLPIASLLYCALFLALNNEPRASEQQPSAA